MQKNLIRICCIFLVIGISNISEVNVIIRFFTGEIDFKNNHYSLTTQSRRFDTRSFTLRNHDVLLKEFNRYKQFYPNDTVLYRTYSINVLKFWNWRNYLFSDFYRYPYLSPQPYDPALSGNWDLSE